MSKGCLKCGMKNADDARVCRGCGTPLSTLFAATQAPPAALARKGLWIGLGALVVALAAGGGVWWLEHARSAAVPTFDSAPPPSMAAASSAIESSAALGATTTPTPTPPPTPPPPPTPSEALPPAPPFIAPSAPTATTSPPTGNLWEPIAKQAALSEPGDKQRRATKDKAARDAKAKALREQRTQAASQTEAVITRRRIEEARARGMRPTSAAASIPRTSSPVPPPLAQPRPVQERCANRSPLAQGICESRECARAEHAGEAVCQRIKAADDRRRDP